MQTIRDLRARIESMQKTVLPDRRIPTHPAIGDLLPGGALMQGTAYSLEHSSMLLMALLAAPSQAGLWCAVVGMPDFGAEAASKLGVDLARLVLVPNPGEEWMRVTAAIADVAGVVAVRPPARAPEGAIARLTGRLRERGATLLVVGAWPHTEAMLSLADSRWHGLGDGHGHLLAREVTVTVTSRTSGVPASARLWLPDSRLQIRRVDVPPTPAAPRSIPDEHGGFEHDLRFQRVGDEALVVTLLE